MSVSRSEAGTFFIAAVAISATVWKLAFNLGAYDTVLYEHLISVWVISAAALVANLVIWRMNNGQFYLPIWGVMVLLLPSVWLWAELTPFWPNGQFGMYCFWAVTAGVVVFSLPYVGYLVLSVAVPQAMQLRRRRFILGLFLVAAFIVAAGYWGGVNNDRFLYCSDFDLAGDARPVNCDPGDPLDAFETPAALETDAGVETSGT